ncbi:MAG TPA: hypothetical protein VE981_17730 [Planctomycetota bacterium]|nr:hypothetical protein [Planctomycetota bacterium]
MTELSSRRAFVSLAAGAAGIAAAAAGPASAAPSAPDAPGAAVAQAAREASLRIGLEPQRRPDAVTAEAHVLLCRSWDSTVYLYVSDRVKGFVTLSAQGLSIAAACQAAGRRVAVRYWGHEPLWADAGHFEGALLALDVRDLPADPGSPA